MTAARPKTATPALSPAPQFYVAETDLFVTGEGFPARAFNAGDRVPAEHVERFGWHGQVSAPSSPNGRPAKEE